SVRMAGKLHPTPARFRGPSSRGRRLCDEWASSRSPYALRQLRKSPAFTISAVLTLAMAIGANAVVFSVINGLILRPLHVRSEESLYSLQRTSRKDTNQSYPDYLDLRDRNHSFEHLVAYSISQVALDTGESRTPT